MGALLAPCFYTGLRCLRYLFKCHLFFPARTPEGNAHRTSLCPAHSLPQPQVSQQRGLQKYSAQFSGLTETLRGRICVWLIQKPRKVMSTGGAPDVISCPIREGGGGVWRLQAVFRRRKFPFIKAWQLLWQSSRNISQSHCRLRKHPPLSFPKRKAAASVHIFQWNPSVFGVCRLPQQECGRGALFIVGIPHT